MLHVVMSPIRSPDLKSMQPACPVYGDVGLAGGEAVGGGCGVGGGRRVREKWVIVGGGKEIEMVETLARMRVTWGMSAGTTGGTRAN